MKRPAICWTIAVIALAVSFVTFAQSKSADVLLRDGMNKETIQRDLPGAIILYQKALEAAGSTNRAVAAKALFRLGNLYKTLGDEKARETLQNVINRYGDQKDVVAQAHALIGAIDAGRPSNTPTNKWVVKGDDADPSAYITFDGRFLSRPDSKTGDVIVRNMSTGRSERLMLVKSDLWEPSDAYAGSAIVSPDGRQVVYQWFPVHKEGEKNSLQLRVTRNERGAPWRELVISPEYCCFEPVGWAPDGQSILVSIARPDRSWQFAWVTLANGEVRNLKSMGWRLRKDRASLSPDGRYLAYSALTEDPPSAVGRYQAQPASASRGQHIYVLPTDGLGEEQEIVRGTNINESPVWTPDGKHLLFVSNRSSTFGLYSIRVENGKAPGSPSSLPVNVAGRVSPIGMSRSGSYYYVPEHAPGGFDLFLAELSASTGKMRGEARRLVENLVDFNRAPAWSPDGKRIAFKRKRPDENMRDLVIYDVSTRREDTYPYSGLDDSRPVWFHDNKTLLLIRRNVPNGRIFKVDPESGAQPRSIEAIAHSMMPAGLVTGATLTADDRTLYVAIAPGSGSRVVSVIALDLVTGDQKSIWNSVGKLNGPPELAVSPDGRNLALTLSREGWTTPRLIRIGMDGKEQELASSVSPGMFAWTKDSRAIVFAAVGQDKSQIVRVAADGGAPEPLGLELNQACACGHSIDLNPDNSSIVFSDSTRKGSVLWVLENVSTLLRASR